MARPGLACRPANGICSLSACVRDGSQLLWTPLQSALDNDDLAAARWLLELGADTEVPDEVSDGLQQRPVERQLQLAAALIREKARCR